MAFFTQGPQISGLVASTRRQWNHMVGFRTDSSTAAPLAAPAVTTQDERPQPTPPPR